MVNRRTKITQDTIQITKPALSLMITGCQMNGLTKGDLKCGDFNNQTGSRPFCHIMKSSPRHSCGNSFMNKVAILGGIQLGIKNMAFQSSIIQEAIIFWSMAHQGFIHTYSEKDTSYMAFTLARIRTSRGTSSKGRNDKV